MQELQSHGEGAGAVNDLAGQGLEIEFIDVPVVQGRAFEREDGRAGIGKPRRIDLDRFLERLRSPAVDRPPAYADTQDLDGVVLGGRREHGSCFLSRGKARAYHGPAAGVVGERGLLGTLGG
jgi:hypothetical protein